MRSDDLYSLPKDLPVPTDDGAAGHLPHAMVPPIGLPSTRGRTVVLADESQRGRVVVYAYPRTGEPDKGPAARVGLGSRSARVHAAELRLPRPARRAHRARCDGLRVVDADDRVPAGD